MKPVEREIRESDAVVVDLKIYRGRRLVKEVAESTLFVKNMVQEVRKKIIGRTSGERLGLEKDGRVTRISIREVKEPIYPEMNDDFAKELGFENLKSLRDKIRKELKNAENLRSVRELEEEIVKQLINQNPFDPPPSSVEARLDEISAKPDERKNYRDHAAHVAKASIILDKIASIENISTSDEELEEEIGRIAGSENISPERLKTQLERSGRIHVLRNRLTHDKVLKFLVNEASITTKKVKE